MSASTLRSIFEGLAQRLGAEIRGSRERPAVSYIDLESAKLEDGYVRLCIDTDDAVAIIETAVPVSAILPADKLTLDKLLALQIMASPSQSGKRLFPALDMRSERLVMSYVTGSESVRGAEDLMSLAETCSVEVALLVKSVSELLDAQDAVTGRSPEPGQAGSARRLGSISGIKK